MNIAVKVPAAETAAEVAATPLEKLNPAKVDRFYNDTIWPVFERLRREDPVHYTPESEYGAYWSVTKWNDIMAVDTNLAVNPTLYPNLSYDPFRDFVPISALFNGSISPARSRD